jgi:hypothetical protein
MSIRTYKRNIQVLGSVVLVSLEIDDVHGGYIAPSVAEDVSSVAKILRRSIKSHNLARFLSNSPVLWRRKVSVGASSPMKIGSRPSCTHEGSQSSFLRGSLQSG